MDDWMGDKAEARSLAGITVGCFLILCVFIACTLFMWGVSWKVLFIPLVAVGWYSGVFYKWLVRDILGEDIGDG